MEAVGVGVFMIFFIAWQESRLRKKTHQDGPCRFCEQWVYWDQRSLHWIHYDGNTHAEWPGIHYDYPGPKPPLHPAAPDTSYHLS